MKIDRFEKNLIREPQGEIKKAFLPNFVLHQNSSNCRSISIGEMGKIASNGEWACAPNKRQLWDSQSSITAGGSQSALSVLTPRRISHSAAGNDFRPTPLRDFPTSVRLCVPLTRGDFLLQVISGAIPCHADVCSISYTKCKIVVL